MRKRQLLHSYISQCYTTPHMCSNNSNSKSTVWSLNTCTLLEWKTAKQQQEHVCVLLIKTECVPPSSLPLRPSAIQMLFPAAAPCFEDPTTRGTMGRGTFSSKDVDMIPHELKLTERMCKITGPCRGFCVSTRRSLSLYTSS